MFNNSVNAMLWSMLIAALSATCDAAYGQSFPNRPVRIVVPFTPGSASDILARIVAQRLSLTWTQPVIVDNRPGAGGTIGTAIVAKAPPDGHTLVAVSAGHVVNPVLYDQLSFDTIRDFAAVIPLANLPSVLAVPRDLQIRSVKEFIAYAKARPGVLNYVSGGIGSGSHVNAEKFIASAEIKALHVPLKGAGDMLTELVSGRAQFGFLPIISAVNSIKDGRVVGLAVSSARRSAALPDVPTVVEAGIAGARFDFWIGLLAPAKTPVSIVQSINGEVARILGAPDVEQRLASMGAVAMPMSPGEFQEFVVHESAALTGLMKSVSVKAD